MTDRDADTVERDDETVDPAMGIEEPTKNFNDLEARVSFEAAITVCMPKSAVAVILRKPIMVI